MENGVPTPEALIGTILGKLETVQDVDTLLEVAAETHLVLAEDPAPERRNVLRQIRARLIDNEFEELPDVGERLARISQILEQYFLALHQAEVAAQAEAVEVAAEAERGVDGQPGGDEDPVGDGDGAGGGDDNIPPLDPPAPQPPRVRTPVADMFRNPIGGGFFQFPAVVPVRQIKREPDAVGAAAASPNDPIQEVVKTLKLQRLNDLKIKGTIGDPGQKGKLDFGNLSYQIHGAKKKGYSAEEIVVAVVAAIDAGSSLRSYLERVDDLTLEYLIKILRAHFKVQTASSMLAAMQKTAQEPDEPLMKFCMKLMVMRDDVNILSQQEPVPHDPVLVQSQFQDSLYTGLLDSNIRMQLRYMLKKSVPSDDDLLAELAEISVTESVCDEKSNGGGNVTVGGGGSGGDDKKKGSDKKSKTNAVSAKKDKGVDPVMARLNQQSQQIDKLTATVDSLTTYLHGQKLPPNIAQLASSNLTTLLAAAAGKDGYQARTSAVGMCSDCQKNKLKFCSHCFKCKGVGHKAGDCPN